MKKILKYLLIYVAPICVNVGIVFSIVQLTKKEAYGFALLVFLIWFILNTIAIPVFCTESKKRYHFVIPYA